MRLQLKRVHFTMLILLCLSTYFHTSVNADILFEEGFNSETKPWGYSGAPWSVSGSDDMSISSTVAREGVSSARVYLNYDTSQTNYRTELVKATTENCNKYFTIGKTYWFAFSIYFGADYSNSAQEDIIWQFHGVPDDEEAYRSPMVVMAVNNSAYIFAVRGDANAIFNEYDRNISYHTELGSVEVGHWTDWVIMVKWDYTTGTTGQVDVWKNGKLLIEDEGANCFNDDVSPYLKFGSYTWPWKKKSPSGTRIRTWYIDRILIGDGDSSYSEMATHNIASMPSNPQNAGIKIVNIPIKPQNLATP